MNVKFNEFLFFVGICLGAVYALAESPAALKSTNQSQPLAKAPQVQATSEPPSATVPPDDSVKVIPHEDIHASNETRPEVNATTVSPATQEATTPKTVPSTVTVTPTETPLTTSPSVPSPAPTAPVPLPSEQGKWIIRDPTTNMTCIIAEMAMQLNVTYPDKSNNMRNATVQGPGKNSTVNGSCSDSSQSMIITWGPGHSLQINFGKNDSVKDFFVSGLSLNVNASIFKEAPNISYIVYTSQEPEFKTPLDMSYKCDKVQRLNLSSTVPKAAAVLTLQNTQLEAYVNKSEAEFGAAQDCDAFDTPDIVPIAVGCALAVLVLVVLVAYLIGRKRSSTTGYLSM